MKTRTIIAVSALLIASGVSAETLRVNNSAGSGTRFTTFEEAINAANDGDVIIMEGSPINYGDLHITKRVTVKGPGYLLGENGISQEGEATASCENVYLKADGAKFTGMYVNKELLMQADNLIVTRNYAYRGISVCESLSFTDKYISNGVIHQNFISGGIAGDHYSASADNMQVTNNVITGDGSAGFGNLSNSLISRNTVIGNDGDWRQLQNCVIENNICWAPVNLSGGNSIQDNFYIESLDTVKLYGNHYRRTDKSMKEVDLTLAPGKGAFSGEDPYLLSGVPAGPFIQDVEMPESVVKGEDLKVTIKIGVSK